ncbi:ChrR Cupin-like domain protein [Variibacter gotjawalensis]|uniref:ChrR Cupin-like domain protein n=1 Tax=Variibacter gotjawalensis TaxID=1333996 RepID=A0A0S3PW24_9BRAD|nr:cupin domain-containing protein [Variibacter gotjawalensis]NIK45959.1 anti-sigma factor ChrR (cupin superfamily) [Variibacter gotjawalensis]RZS47877.1 ChrR-like anti-ECFsigma factor [Variibacter gotjawalensis]BAT60133.1 ChrR Cupin-like domain protein [Variibacter gotjawalensis]
MAAISPGNPQHESLTEKASRHVKTADLPWEKTRFPGCEVKTLLVDPATGLATVLVKMAPGAELPDHEHAMIEQTYVLEGVLVDKDGPDAGLSVGPGEYVWRPPGSRHAAWAPNGCVCIGMFQAPNKFYEKNGEVTDMMGRNWQLNWSHTVVIAVLE